mgnify:FL=1|tara:strand:- start:1187 stop:2167 length:981 start_codon:yes stop_codon:yes gene_type:complete
MKILITGGAGYIGSHVSHLLVDRGYNITIIDSLLTGNKKLIPKKAKFINSDISNVKKINRILQKNKFDLVIHFAGLIRVDESVKFPKKYLNNNYEKTKIFLSICLKNGLKKLIFSSTAAVYGNPKKNKVSENNKLNPLNPYAKSKLMIENFIKKLSKKNDLKFVILRYFNVAGADKKMRTGLISKYSTHLIKIVSEVAVKKRKKILINGDNYKTRDGTPIRDYIHVSDLAEAHLLSLRYLLKGNKSGIFNCGYGKGYSVKEIIQTANKLFNNTINFSIGPKRPGDSKYVVANPNKFIKTMKWKPKFNNIKKIIISAVNWEKKLKFI